MKLEKNILEIKECHQRKGKVERLGNSLIEGNEEVVFDLGISTMLEFFQSEVKMAVERKELKIRERRSEIIGAVLWNMIEEMPSGLEAVSIGI